MAAEWAAILVQKNMYDFLTTWTIPYPRSITYTVMLDSSNWQTWWSGLERVEAIQETASGIDSIYDCVWRSQAGYRLRTRIVITEHVDGELIAFDSTGDLVGNGIITFDDDTTVSIRWRVEPAKWWMKVSGPTLRPFFTANHTQLMRQGEAGLIEYIRSESYQEKETR